MHQVTPFPLNPLREMLPSGILSGIFYGRDLVALSRTCTKFGLRDAEDDASALNFVDRYVGPRWLFVSLPHPLVAILGPCGR